MIGPKITLELLQKKKAAREKIVMLTAADYPIARLAEESGAEIILVGDSLGMAVLGLDSTVSLTLEEMLYHTKAVVRAARRALVITDLPFGSYQLGPQQALASAIRLIKEGGAQGVKLEGGQNQGPAITALTAAGIPVIAHIGLLPQTATLGRTYQFHGRDAFGARELLESALALEAAGAFALVLECVTSQAAALITAKLQIPTIGIGSGPYCDGQVLVSNDLLGLTQGHIPKFVRQYADLSRQIGKAFAAFGSQVRQGEFPGPEHSFDGAEEIEKTH
jgi:3-methyl-2-oxobutanoate hydroxymethyltransferase